ncbi:acyl-CoA carboxylase subunit epsilon [Streptomyces aureus]
MGEADAAPLALRIERGRADDDELAALTVVLCSLLAGRRAHSGEAGEPQVPAAVPSWRRPQVLGSQWRSPHGWR